MALQLQDAILRCSGLNFAGFSGVIFIFTAKEVPLCLFTPYQFSTPDYYGLMLLIKV